MRRIARWFRRARFFLLQHLVLPTLIVPFRLLVWSWRKHPLSDAQMRQIADCPRIILVTYHGMLLQLLAFARFALTYRAPLVAMVTPSLDGRLAGAAIRRFGIDTVWGTAGNRSIAGSREFLRRIEDGDVGVLVADGPRGPCGAFKPGVIRIAAAARANLVLVSLSSNHAVPLGSWDRARLPLPFARVRVALELRPPPKDGNDPRELSETAEAMLSTARAVQSPMLAPELRWPASEGSSLKRPSNGDASRSTARDDA